MLLNIPVEMLLVRAERRLVILVILQEVLPSEAVSDARDLLVLLIDYRHANRR